MTPQLDYARLTQLAAGTPATDEEVRILAGEVRRIRYPEQLRVHDLAHNGTPTSMAAAKSMRGPARRQRKLVEQFVLDLQGSGATSDEVEQALQLQHQTASARLHDLANDGVLIRTEYTRPTRSGRRARVYIHRTQVLVEHPDNQHLTAR